MQPRPLDLDFVRSWFPVFATSAGRLAHFENAGGSYACSPTVDALAHHYVATRVQPHGPSAPSGELGAAMDGSRERWADALGVEEDEVHLGPSTTANTTVLAHAFAELLGPGDEVIVTDQDHEANRGPVARAAERAGATVRVWSIDSDTGLLDRADLEDLLDADTRLVHLPHVSNIVGVENDVHTLTRLAHEAGAWTVVDGVSAAPHGIPEVGHLHADVYLCSLYKVYSVHQGLMTVRRELLDRLPNQSHFFNAGTVHKKLNPAGPDHAQVAASGAVLDYVEAFSAHHEGPTDDLGAACRFATECWQAHERRLATPVLDHLGASDRVRLIGPSDDSAGHRHPTIAFSPESRDPAAVATALAERDVVVGAGFFYAWRTLEGLGIDPRRGVNRISLVHYTSDDDVDRLLGALTDVLG